MEEKVNGIVIKTTDYMDYDSILSVFTAEKGMLTLRMKGVKKAGAKLKFAAEPFCFAEYIVAEKNGKRTVTGATLTNGFYPLRDNFKSYLCASVVLDFLRKFCPEGVVMTDLFAAAVRGLSYISYKEDPERWLAAFLLDALTLCGYGLDTENCSSCGTVIESPKIYFDTNGGGFICENCYYQGCSEVSRETYEAVFTLANGNDAYISPFRLYRILRFLDFYIFNKVGENLNSLKLLLKSAPAFENR